MSRIGLISTHCSKPPPPPSLTACCGHSLHYQPSSSIYTSPRTANRTLDICLERTTRQHSDTAFNHITTNQPETATLLASHHTLEAASQQLTTNQAEAATRQLTIDQPKAANHNLVTTHHLQSLTSPVELPLSHSDDVENELRSCYTIKLSPELTEAWLRYKRDMNFVSDEEFVTFLLFCATQSMSGEVSDTAVIPNSVSKSQESLPPRPRGITASSSQVTCKKKINIENRQDHLEFQKYPQNHHHTSTTKLLNTNSCPGLIISSSSTQNTNSVPPLQINQDHRTPNHLSHSETPSKRVQHRAPLHNNKTPTSASMDTTTKHTPVSGSGGFECDSCKKVFALKNYLARHLKRGVCTEPARLYQCQHCSTAVKSLTLLRVHVKQTHRDVRYSCEQCDKKFKNAEYVAQHVRVSHNRIKAHRCGECGKAFTQRGTMLLHVRTVHQKQRNYTCRLCDRSFSCKSHLTRHRQTIHGDIMEKECELCGEVFKKPSDLIHHTKLIHYETEFICNICNKTFKLKHTLAQHIAKSHPTRINL